MEISPVEALLGTFCSCRCVHGQGTSKLPAGDTAAWRFQFPGKADADARAWLVLSERSPQPPPLLLSLAGVAMAARQSDGRMVFFRRRQRPRLVLGARHLGSNGGGASIAAVVMQTEGAPMSRGHLLPASRRRTARQCSE